MITSRMCDEQREMATIINCGLFTLLYHQPIMWWILDSVTYFAFIFKQVETPGVWVRVCVCYGGGGGGVL